MACPFPALGQDGARAAHGVEHHLARLDFRRPDHCCSDGGPQRSRQMLHLVLAMAHRSVRKPQAADGRGAVNRQPDLDRGIFLRVAPACRQLPGQPFGQRLAGVGATVAMLARHLRHQTISRLAGRLGPNGVMDTEEAIPVNLMGGPAPNLLQIRRAPAELVGAPGEQEHVFHRSELQERGVHVLGAEDHDAGAAALDVAAHFTFDLLFGDRFQPWKDHGIAGRQRLRRGSALGHGICDRPPRSDQSCRKTGVNRWTLVLLLRLCPFPLY